MNVVTFENLPNAVTMLTKEVSELKQLIIKIQQPPINQTEKLLTIDELAVKLHVSKATIYTKVSKKQIPGVCKQGKRLYFDYEIIIDWIKQGRRKSNAEIKAEVDAYLSNNKKGLK